MREERYRLKGTSVVFPDGVPVCLACGKRSTKTRRVWFESPDATPSLTQAGGLAKDLAAIATRTTFDAPLCAEHHGRARLFALKAGGYGLLGTVIFVGVILMLLDGPLKPEQHGFVAWLPLIPAVVPWFFAYFAWQKKDRGGLECEARREGDELVLTWPSTS